MTVTSKTILITGGSRGIGKATAILAALRGWSVVLNYKSDKMAAEETAAEIRAIGTKVHVIKADVSIENDVVEMFIEADKTFGPINAVVINAGIVESSMTLAEMDTDRLRRVIDTNLFGALLCAREAVKFLTAEENMETANSGNSIVFVSSAASRLGSPFEYVDYAATKGAMDTLTIGLSKELAPNNIRVNAVRPGLIETDIHASGGQPHRAQKLAHMVPMKRPGTATEVAEAIIWLLSDEASYTTGAVMDVAGGR